MSSCPITAVLSRGPVSCPLLVVSFYYLLLAPFRSCSWQTIQFTVTNVRLVISPRRLVGRAGLRQCMGYGIVSKAVPDRLGLAVITSAFNSCWCDCVLYLWCVHLCAVYCMYRSVCVSGGTQHSLWLCTQSAKCILLSVHSCRPLDCM